MGRSKSCMRFLLMQTPCQNERTYFVHGPDAFSHNEKFIFPIDIGRKVSRTFQIEEAEFLPEHIIFALDK